MEREGPFWDVIRGDADPSAAAETLGWELLEVDPDAGTIEVAFTADGRFLNPIGVVQGGFLAAMLDDTLGPALVATLEADQFAPTADLHVQFAWSAGAGSCAAAGTWLSWPASWWTRRARWSRLPPRRPPSGQLAVDTPAANR